jgi:hypothetical protein
MTTILLFFFALCASKIFMKRSRTTTTTTTDNIDFARSATLCASKIFIKRSRRRIDIIDEIPEEIWISLLKKSPNNVIFIMQFVCKKWNEIIKNNNDTKWMTEIKTFIKGTNTAKDFSECLMGLRLPIFGMIPPFLSHFDLEYKCALLSIKHDNIDLFLNLCKEIVYCINEREERGTYSIWQNNDLRLNLGLIYIPRWIGIYEKASFLKKLSKKCWGPVPNGPLATSSGHVPRLFDEPDLYNELHNFATEIDFKHGMVACEYDFPGIIDFLALRCSLQNFNINQLYDLIVKCIEKNSLNCLRKIIPDTYICRDKEIFAIIVEKQSLDFLLKIIETDRTNIRTIMKYADFLIKETKNEEIVNYLKRFIKI